MAHRSNSDDWLIGGWTRASVIAGCGLLSSLAFSACDKKDKPAPAPAASSYAPAELPAELKSKVLAEVGGKKITLGQFAATLERMDRFERLRYESKERRQELLEEMIDVELLAQEARRRGLDKTPEAQERLRQILRDELLAEVRKEVADATEIPAGEVRRYYEQHTDEFFEPERRRAAKIEVRSRRVAEQLLEQAIQASPERWGELYKQHSQNGTAPVAALELAGDVGIVTPPGSERGENPNISEPVRKALFAIEELGGVYPKLVEHENKYIIVRLIGRTPARKRTYEEAERAIRTRLVQERIRDREKAFERELRKRYPVSVDEKAVLNTGLQKRSAE